MFSFSCPDDGVEWTYTGEPSAAELVAIEAESLVLPAEYRLVVAQINVIVDPSAVSRRQFRRALKHLLAVRA